MKRARSKENKEIKKNEIKKSAIKIFLKNTQDLPSVSQIATEANLSKGALYTYYNSKEEVFLEIISDQYIAWFTEIELAIEQTKDFISLLDNIFDPLLKNTLFLELNSSLSQVIEVKSGIDKTVEFKILLGEKVEIITYKISRKFNISNEILLKNIIESFTVILGAYQMSKLPHPNIRQKVPYAFLFPNFELHAKNLLRKIWQF